MKKLLIATNVLLLTVILLQAYNQTGNKKSGFLRPPIACPLSICCNYAGSQPAGLISGSLAMSMSQDYSRDLGKAHIQNGSIQSNMQDALYVSFDLEKIKNFIWHIEHAVCMAGCDTSQKTGIRFYYAKYPPNTGKPDGPSQLKTLSTDCANKHTLFMVPEYLSKVDKKWHDFDYDSISFGCHFKQFVINQSGYAQKAPSIMMNVGDGDNHGGIGPPPKPGTFGSN